MSDLSNLSDRIRVEAARLLEPGHKERLETIAADVDRLQRGAKTLGHIIESNGRAILDITGRHDLIGEDGDGDWGAVWDHLYELPAKALRAAADEMEAVIADGDCAEVAAPVPGEVRRSAVVARRDALHEEPHEWLRAYATSLATSPAPTTPDDRRCG